MSANVLAAVQQSGATRNVYLGNLDEQVTEQTLRDDLSRFGPIDQVKIVRDKNIGFVHFLSIATAIKVVQNLPQEPGWVGRRVAYGKDRTAYVPKNQHQQQQHNMAAAAMGSMAATYGGFGGLGFGSPNMGAPFTCAFLSLASHADETPTRAGFGQNGDPNAQPGNRTIYLGVGRAALPSLARFAGADMRVLAEHPPRGDDRGDLQHHPRRHSAADPLHPRQAHRALLPRLLFPGCAVLTQGLTLQCFVTFVDPHCALAFYQTASFQGIALHNRRLKVGWVRRAFPLLPPRLAH